jgi:hypothetical protein
MAERVGFIFRVGALVREITAMAAHRVTTRNSVRGAASCSLTIHEGLPK